MPTTTTCDELSFHFLFIYRWKERKKERNAFIDSKHAWINLSTGVSFIAAYEYVIEGANLLESPPPPPCTHKQTTARWTLTTVRRHWTRRRRRRALGAGYPFGRFLTRRVIHSSRGTTSRRRTMVTVQPRRRTATAPCKGTS